MLCISFSFSFSSSSSSSFISVSISASSILLSNSPSSMDSASSRASPLSSCPFSSPKPAALLKKAILGWSQETGLPPTVCVRVQEETFYLHKVPLVSRSGYFKKALLASPAAVELPRGFPGGAEVFEMVALFSYGSPLPLDPFTVSALRCAAEFLEMTEEHAAAAVVNLREAADLYLNQVVLQSWDDTLIALQTCRAVLPMAEELLIVSRCVESLAFMACMEILDPEQRRDRPVVTLHAMAGRPWNAEAVKEIAGRDLWIKDLIALPLEFFTRIIRSLRRQGMKEKYVIPIIIFYANKWVLSKKTHKFWQNTAEEDGANAAINKVSAVLQGVLDLLPTAGGESEIIPVTFFFALLAIALELDLGDGIRSKLQDHVAFLLHFARPDDFLLPDDQTEDMASSPAVKTMERIVSVRMSSKNQKRYGGSSAVAELWDMYLCRIAIDARFGAGRFMELVERVPMADRESHDHLYKAINTFLSAHPDLPSEAKARICSKISCRKLSQECCIQAVQDELMPLRLIIQALFVQQLHTQQAFKDCSESFRFIHCGDFTGSIPSSSSHLPKNLNLDDGSPSNPPAAIEETPAVPLASLLMKDRTVRRSNEGLAKAEYESTSIRIQALEQELASLKHNIHGDDTSKSCSSKRTASRKGSFRMFAEGAGSGFVRRNPLGHASGCIGSLSWASQRRYANRLLKVFRRIAMLGKGKPNIRQMASGSLACTSNKSLHEMYDC